MLFLSVRGFLDYAGPADRSRFNAARRFAFLPLGTESAPCSSVFRSSIARPTNSPDLRFAQHLAMLTARLGAKMDSLLLSCTTLSFATTCRFIPAHVAVGTTIADRPPHRTVRARLRIRLPPWMSGVKALRGIRVQDAGYRNPAVQNRVKPIPGCPALLTATEQNKPPQPS